MAAGRIWAVGHSWLHSALQARAGRGGPRRAVVVVQVNWSRRRERRDSCAIRRPGCCKPIAVLSLDRPALRPLVLETSLRSLAYAFFRCILKGRFEHRMRSSV